MGVYRSIGMWFGIVAAGVIVILFIQGALSPSGFVKPAVTEEVVVTHVVGDSCIVDTRDTALSAKMVKNCNVSPGTKVIVKYEQGSQEATLVQP